MPHIPDCPGHPEIGPICHASCADSAQNAKCPGIRLKLGLGLVKVGLRLVKLGLGLAELGLWLVGLGFMGRGVNRDGWKISICAPLPSPRS